MIEITQEEVSKFMAELEALSRKHNIVIGGCGCCGSPFLYREESMGREDYYQINGFEYIKWSRKQDRDNLEAYKNRKEKAGK